MSDTGNTLAAALTEPDMGDDYTSYSDQFLLHVATTGPTGLQSDASSDL